MLTAFHFHIRGDTFLNFIYNTNYNTPIVYNGVPIVSDPSTVIHAPDDVNHGKTFYEVFEFTESDAAAFVLEAKWNQVREYRDLQLKETDWVSGEDVPQAIKDVWFPYRQTLRDITSIENPDDVVWPTKPQ